MHFHAATAAFAALVSTVLHVMVVIGCLMIDDVMVMMS